jgi:hypothetical protein
VLIVKTVPTEENIGAHRLKFDGSSQRRSVSVKSGVLRDEMFLPQDLNKRRISADSPSDRSQLIGTFAEAAQKRFVG